MGFKARSPLGWAFTREHGADPAYCQLKRNEEKTEFRRQWAEARWEAKSKVREQTRGYKHIDLSRGRYRSPTWILREEGGRDDPAARESTRRFVEECIKMGPPWYKRNNQLDRVDFLILEEGYEEAFEKAWTERVTREGPTPGSSAETSDSAKMHFDQKAAEQAPPEDAQPRGQRAA